MHKQDDWACSVHGRVYDITNCTECMMLVSDPANPDNQGGVNRLPIDDTHPFTNCDQGYRCYSVQCFTFGCHKRDYSNSVVCERCYLVCARSSIIKVKLPDGDYILLCTSCFEDCGGEATTE
jgi:hypothetical protein